MTSQGVIDAHCHLFPPDWARHGLMPPDMFDFEALLERQAAAGVATSIVSDPHIWYGDLDTGDISRSREYNEFAAELGRTHPLQIAPLGTVTPWRGEDHLLEAERAVRQLGLRGLAIPTSDNGRYLDTIGDAFWEVVADLDLPVSIHPGGTALGNELMQMYRLGEVCGRPLDTTLTLARYILTGTAACHPRVRLLCAHAGGAICTIADRLDFGMSYDATPLSAPGERSSWPSRPRPTSLASIRHGDVRHRGAAAGPLAGRPSACSLRSDRPPVPFDLERTIGYVR